MKSQFILVCSALVWGLVCGLRLRVGADDGGAPVVPSPRIPKAQGSANPEVPDVRAWSVSFNLGVLDGENINIDEWAMGSPLFPGNSVTRRTRKKVNGRRDVDADWFYAHGPLNDIHFEAITLQWETKMPKI